MGVEQFFGGRPLNVPCVDGEHSYAGACRDHELDTVRLSPDGRIAFHAIVNRPETTAEGVLRLWREIRPPLADRMEPAESSEPWGYGIGVGRRQTGDGLR